MARNSLRPSSISPLGVPPTLFLGETPTLTIAIGGCSSSGKSTLAILLAEILRQVGVANGLSPSNRNGVSHRVGGSCEIMDNSNSKFQEDTTANPNESFDPANSNRDAKNSTSKSTSNIPNINIASTSPARNNPLNTVMNNQNDPFTSSTSLSSPRRSPSPAAAYSRTLSPSRSAYAPCPSLSPGYTPSSYDVSVTANVDPIIISLDILTKEPADCPAVRFRAVPSKDRQLLRHMGPGASGLIDAHDVDCLAAVRWGDVERLTRAARRGQQPRPASWVAGTQGQDPVPSSRTHERLPSDSLASALSRTAAIRRAALQRAHRGLVAQAVSRLRAGVESRLHARAFARRVTIVEGALTLAKIRGDDARDHDEDDQTAAQRQNRLGVERVSDFLTKEEASKRERLARCYDVKLWLGLEKDVARERRFRRAEFVDVVKGGERQAQELWRFEGYWEDISWTNHERYHEYLLHPRDVLASCRQQQAGRTNIVDGVRIRPANVLNLEDTVLWAVDMVASELRECIYP